ncbi:MAG: Carboxypeptidase precursor [Verrucomicrobiota bacterium]|jgi:glutamate carboxypeptidase
MNLDSLRDLLIRWCHQNSGSEHIAGLEAMRGLLAAEFGTLPDAAIEHVALRDTPAKALRIRVRPEAPVQFLCSGHYDTVYGADHPFQTCSQPEADLLRGPGVADMKGGLVVMLAALRQLEQSAAAKNVGYEVLLTPDEETGSHGSAPVIAESATRHRFALVFEPARANGDLVRSRMGTGVFTLTVHGRAAHAAQVPNDGRNAILALCEILPAVAALPEKMPGVLVNIGHVTGGGAVNIVPDLARAKLNVRITNNGDDDRILSRLREIIAPLNAREGFRAEITGGFDRGPKVETPAETALFAAWQGCAREEGVTLDWQHVGGGSDGNLLSAAGLPNLDGLGPVGAHLHSDREQIRLSSLAERARIAANFLIKLATGRIPPPHANPKT